MADRPRASKPSKHSIALNSGYEKGSVEDTFNQQQRREFREWLKKMNGDNMLFEKQLSNWGRWDERTR